MINPAMTTQVPRLNLDQVRQFKQDGYLVLPAVLDPKLCRRAHDQLWETIGDELPRMHRDDPATWTPITEDEADRLDAHQPQIGGDPYFHGKGHRLHLRNGAEQHMIDLAPRALWEVAEQLFGAGTLVWPDGADPSGYATGPCFMCDAAVGGVAAHHGVDEVEEPPEATFTTQTVRLPATGPVWLNGQGSRGVYCTLPNSPSRGPDYHSAHSDGACYGRFRLQLTAYIDAVPPESGAFTVWPGSHARIWPEQWAAFWEGEKHTDKHLAVRRAGGYTAPVITQIKGDTKPVDCHGPTGTVVLWHTKILHMANQNRSRDVLRQATIYGYLKTAELLPDELIVDNTDGDIWRDWSEEVRTVD